MTDDVIFPYFLKKQTCTQFIFPSGQVLNGISEDRFINQLKNSSPNIILYKSPNEILYNPLNMPKAVKFINDNYYFFENFNDYIFYKKK